MSAAGVISLNWRRDGHASSDDLCVVSDERLVAAAKIGHKGALSGSGADPTERSRMPFARYIGEVERGLLAAGFPRAYIFRPGYIYPVEPSKEPSFRYRLLRGIYPLFRVLFPNQMIRADDLGRAMVDAGRSGTAQRGSPVFREPRYPSYGRIA
jgi:uncharacterized protein YbjT (DUF2867 family)